MFYLGALLFELVVLFSFSKTITQNLFFVFYGVFKSQQIAATLIFVLFFPGVFLHELSHFLAAEVLLVKAHDLRLSPQINAGHLRMGSVVISKTDIVRSFLIGVAPILSGSFVLVFGVYFFLNNLSWVMGLPLAWSGVVFVCFGWFLFFVSNTMFSSKKDVETLVPLLFLTSFLLLVLLIALAFLKINTLGVVGSLVNGEGFVLWMRLACLFLLFPIGVDLIIVFVSRFFVKKLI